MSKGIWTVVILALVIGGIIAAKFILSGPDKTIDSNVSRTVGPLSARVQIVEFIDFQCPSCAYGYKTLKKYVEKHPNDIRVQLKYFPLHKIHVHAKSTAMYGECAAKQGKFWPFVDRLLDQQQKWSPMINADQVFMGMAKEAGLDLGTLNVCLADEATAKALEQDQQLGKTLAVSSTPTYFINDKMVVGSKSLEQELKTLFPSE